MRYTRKFNGKVYEWKGDYNKKSSARSAAKFVRSKGGKARVVKRAHGYAVYER